MVAPKELSEVNMVQPASALALLGLVACMGASAPASLSDTDLTAYAARPFDKRAMMFKHVVVGVHHGASVVADFPCGDICQDYTTRIIHYDVTPGAACRAI